ncbi:hypothetical protein ACFHYO_10650 [Paracoccus panacisoli]|uniref:Uncharacterized protein n=1 Tax=Paracoccus panacisoli TaxID=1510163 RepID=A0ABV6T7H0_9RHOB
MGINIIDCPRPPCGDVEIVAENPRLSNPEMGTENENPGALAGATGADLHGSRVDANYTLTRRAAAIALADAAVDCPPEIRARLLERLLDQFRPAWPMPAFMGRVMEEAGFWADMASRAELKAYALACYRRMPPQDRIAFIDFLAEGRA